MCISNSLHRQVLEEEMLYTKWPVVGLYPEENILLINAFERVEIIQFSFEMLYSFYLYYISGIFIHMFRVFLSPSKCFSNFLYNGNTLFRALE